MKIKNISKNTFIATNCRVADNFISRFLGLMGAKNLPSESGLLITPCNSIHMFFMKIPLDIVFIDKANTVVYLIENIAPWKFSSIIRKAHSVIELPIGTIAKSNTVIGDKLQFIN